MKKKGYKILTATFAMALVLASPMTATTSYAWGLNADAGYGSGGSDIDADAAWAAWEANNSSSSSSSESGSSSESSYSEPSYSESSGDSASSGASSSIGTVSTGTKKVANDVVVSVTGGQKFRIVMSKDHTSYQVFHCGCSKATFTVTDAKGNAVVFSNVTLEKGEDNLWYINTTFAEGVDTKDFTVNVTKGDASYLSTTLGVSGIKIGGTVALSTVPATDAK